MGDPVLTTTGADGRPVVVRARRGALTDDGFSLMLPRDAIANAPLEGAACVTLHAHPSRFTSQENMVFVGEARRDGDAVDVRVARQVGAFSLGTTLGDTVRAIRTRGPQLHKRLAVEAARRGLRAVSELCRNCSELVFPPSPGP